MSMSQRSIAVSTMRRPYDSTPFRSHARSSAENEERRIGSPLLMPGNFLILVEISASSRRMVTLSATFRPAQGPNSPDGRRRWARRRSLAACFAIGAGEWSSVRRGERVTSCAAWCFLETDPGKAPDGP